MPLRLPRFERTMVLIEEDNTTSLGFHLWWQRVVEAIEANDASQQATIDRIKRISSHTEPTRVLTASDNGLTATITVSNHVRVMGDGTTLSITGGNHALLVSDTPYGVYYDDTTLLDTTPAYIYTTTIEDAQAAKADGRFFLGVIRTPVAGSGDIRDGGGAYPAGSAPGGEV